MPRRHGFDYLKYSKAMGLLSSLEKGFFVRVIEMEAFPLQSRLLFAILESTRLLSKDLFIVLAFLTPFPLFSDFTQWGLRQVEATPAPLTLTLTLLLLFLSAGYGYGSGFMWDKFKGVLRYFTIWLDLGALPVISLSIIMAKSPNQSLLLMIANIICIGLLFVFSMLKAMFRVSKHYKSDNLTHRRLVPFCSLAHLGNLILVIILSLKYKVEKGIESLTAIEMVVFSLCFLFLSLIKLSTSSPMQNSGCTCGTTSSTSPTTSPASST